MVLSRAENAAHLSRCPSLTCRELAVGSVGLVQVSNSFWATVAVVSCLVNPSYTIRSGLVRARRKNPRTDGVRRTFGRRHT